MKDADNYFQYAEKAVCIEFLFAFKRGRKIGQGDTRWSRLLRVFWRILPQGSKN